MSKFRTSGYIRQYKILLRDDRRLRTHSGLDTRTRFSGSYLEQTDSCCGQRCMTPTSTMLFIVLSTLSASCRWARATERGKPVSSQPWPRVCGTEAGRHGVYHMPRFKLFGMWFCTEQLWRIMQPPFTTSRPLIPAPTPRTGRMRLAATNRAPPVNQSNTVLKQHSHS